eukprot:SAG22_NODE_21292_length_258_cov_0.754717_1_plen_25_part_01
MLAPMQPGSRHRRRRRRWHRVLFPP